MPKAAVGELRIAYERKGEGAPLLLLHPAFLDRRVWDRVLPDLARRLDVIAPDLPGHGESEVPETWRPDMVTFLVEFLDAMNVDQASAVGSSFGGGLLIRTAAEHPSRFERLILSAPTGIPKTEMDKVREKVPKSKSTWEAFQSSFEDPSLATRDRYREYGRLQKVAAPFIRRYRETHPPDYETTGWVPQMRSLQCPVLLLWGDRDAVIPPPMDRRTQEEIPGSRLVVWKGAKHFPFLDRPAEFATLVADFLEGRPVER